MEALTSLIREDATQSMPPYDLWLRGPRRHLHLVVRPRHRLQGLARDPDRRANGSPAFGQYKPSPDGGYEPWALQVLELAGGRIGELTFFLDTERLFPLLACRPPGEVSRLERRRCRTVDAPHWVRPMAPARGRFDD